VSVEVPAELENIGATYVEVEETIGVTYAEAEETIGVTYAEAREKWGKSTSVAEGSKTG